jgi:Do/DeqQ family serine protease
MAISVVALAVSLSHGLPQIRVGHAADPQVTERQKQALVNLQDAFTNIADSAEPAVVNIQVEPAITKKAAADTNDNADDDTPDRNFNPFGDLPFDFGPFGRRGAPQMPPMQRGTAAGSGVIVDKTGNEYYILTNNHVVDGGGRIKVQLNGIKEDVRGTLVGRDPKTDLAVVKVRLTGNQDPHRVAQFGNSDHVKVGQWAIAIGNPLGVGQTLTVGVVSAKGRSIDRIEDSSADYFDMIQTDASINPGNSGGALVDINGDVVGINTAIASTTRGSIGIGFAIPANTAKKIADQLIRNGEVVRGWLGVQTFQSNWEIRPAIAKMYGVDHGAFIEEVRPNTPASRAGIESEDIVTQWGNTPIQTYQELTAAVGSTPPGERVPVKLVRHGKEMTVTVLTEKRPDEATLMRGDQDEQDNSVRPSTQEDTQTAKANGLSVRSLRGSERQSVGGGGVVVTDVEEGSAAVDAGIIPGTVIQRINQTPINTLDDFKAAMAKIRGSESYVLRVSRPTSTGSFARMTLVVTPDE